MSDERYGKGDGAYIAPGAVLVGDISIGPESSVWPSAVVRADMAPIRIGQGTSIQDNVTIHTNEGSPTLIGDYVTVGHNAVIHGATVEDYCIIGMGAIVLDGAVIGSGTIVGAGAVVPSGKHIPPNSLVLGIPGRVVKEGNFMEQIKANAEEYIKLARRYMSGDGPHIRIQEQ